MLLNSVCTPEFAEITPIACRVPCAAVCGIVGTAVDKTLTKLPCEQPHGGWHWLNKLELIWGLRCAFLLSLPKQQIPLLFCPKLSKQKSYVATLPDPFTLWFVLTKNLIEGGSAEDLLMGISTQALEWDREWLTWTTQVLFWSGGDGSFLSALPASLPKHCLENSSMCQSGALSPVLRPQKSCFRKLYVFRFLLEWFVGSH